MPLTAEVVWDTAIPPAMMQLGSDSGLGSGGGEDLESCLGNIQSAAEGVCPFGLIICLDCFC